MRFVPATFSHPTHDAVLLAASHAGDYPPVFKLKMTKVLGADKVPAFTNWEMQLLRGSLDFIAVNVYTAR